MKKFFVLHPFLFAIFPMLFIYSQNINEISLSEIIYATIIILVVVLLLQSLLPLIFLNKTKIALIISLSIFIFFFYGHIYEILKGFSLLEFQIKSDKVILLILFLIFVEGVYLIIKTRKNIENLTYSLNIMSVSLIVISLANIALHELKRTDTFEINKNDSIEISKEIVKNASIMPDIYYIILDAYTSSRALKEIYDYDNSDFENFLSKKGFYIASESRSNYAETRLSLASSLNMEHLNILGELVDVPMLYKMINKNKVMQILKLHGYNIINVSSTNIGKIEEIENADLNFQTGCFLSVKFQAVLIETTILRAFKKYFDFAYYYRKEILSTFLLISEAQMKIKEPRFIFAHILSPHPPYVFDPDGEPTYPTYQTLRLDAWGDLSFQKKLYLGQVIFVNKLLKNIIDKILSETKREPIIIIQGDHGPQLATNERLNARMKIFNAYYLPKKDQNFFYDSITPVNTFRLIFNHYFNTNYELLEDKSYFTLYELPYHFVDVTDSVSNN